MPHLARASFALLLAAILTTPLLADPINWSVRSTTNSFAIIDGVTGGFTFPNQSFVTTAGDGRVELTKVQSYSIATAEEPDRITSLPYSFNIELRDDLSQQTAELSFAGTLSGTYWRTGNNLTNTFSNASQSVELGGNLYRISLSEFVAPTGYGDEGGGSIFANVALGVTDDDDDDGEIPDPVGGGDGGGPLGPIGGVNTPEPATLALAALGLPLAGAFFRRKRK